MELTIKINGVCKGGGHVFLTVTKNGTQSKAFVLNRDDFFIEPEEYETVLVTLLRSLIEEQNFTTNTPLNQIKAAVEAKVFKL